VIEHCELTIAGRVARSVLDTIEDRFELRAVRRSDGPPDRGSVSRTVLTVVGVDQPAVRALMIMLWDSGHDVLAMSTGACGTAGAEPRPG